jgi:ribosomal protein S18 acetylase RimI-like enzyme
LIEKYDRTRHDAEEVKNLLSMAIGYPTQELLRKLLDVVYDIKGYHLFVIKKRGLFAPDKGTITGIIGVDITLLLQGWILHLAVHPDYRKRGIGKSMIRQVTEEFKLESVTLETDQDAVDFYRACGFTAVEIPSKWRGIHRYRCTKGQAPKSVLEYYDNLIPH